MESKTNTPTTEELLATIQRLETELQEANKAKRKVNPQRLKGGLSRDDWETPPELFRKLDDIFVFSLDACALPETAKVDLFFTPEQDGLEQRWGSHVVWCNPPYKNWAKWAEKALVSAMWEGTVVVLLVPPRTDSSAWHEYARTATAQVHLKGRVSFLADGKKVHGNTHPSTLLIWDLFGRRREAIEALGQPGPPTRCWDWRKSNA